LGRKYELEDVQEPSQSHMERLREIAERCGVRTQIGG
jgi:hypothetical protein